MVETGLVISTCGDRAQVSIKRKAQCDKCGMCIFPKGADSVTFDCINKVGAVAGDRVKLEKEGQNKMLSYLLIFFVPLLLIGASVAIGLFVIKIDYWVLILSGILLVAWFSVLALIDKVIKKSGKLSPVIIEVVNGQDLVNENLDEDKDTSNEIKE